MNLGTSQRPRPMVPLFLLESHHLSNTHLAQAAGGGQRLWAHLLVCVQMSTLVWGCRMTSKEAMASV